MLYSTNPPQKIYHFEGPGALLLYIVTAFSILLLANLSYLILKRGYTSELVQGRVRRLKGKSPKEEKMLLHTLPYYLAITRSTCEVSLKRIYSEMQ